MRGGFHHHHGPSEQDKTDVNYKETYVRLLKFARPYLYLVIIVLLLALVSSFIGVLPAQVTGVAIDKIFNIGQQEQQLQNESVIPEELESGQSSNIVENNIDEKVEPGSFKKVIPISPMVNKITDYVSENILEEWSYPVVVSITLAAIFILLFVISQIIIIIQGFITVYIGQSLIYDIRNKVYRHLQRLSFKYFEDRQTGDIMARVVNDVDSLADVIVGPVIELLTNISSLIFVLYFCLIWDWRLTLMALIAAPLLLLVTRYFGKRLRKNFRELRKRIGELNGLVQDNISGIRVIKSFTQEDHEFDKFDGKNKKTYDSRLRLGILFRVFRPIISSLNQIGTVVVLFYGSIQVYAGLISPGIFVTFFRYLPKLYNPITGFSRIYNRIQRALASSERVFEVLDTEAEIKDDPEAIDLKEVKGEVEFKKVSFSYDNENVVLKNINLKVSSGQMIAFVGPSGAGKTTLINLIPRFYDPTQGEICLDGYNLKKIKTRTLRECIGIVQQDPFLFNDTVKANIEYGKLNATQAEIVNAAKAANCHEFITELPEQYQTRIGERGVKLSGGQKQRLSIARAILADPKILILDEATSSVDTETENLIQKAIDNLVQDRTTFIIAHRLSTIQEADSIVVLDDGAVVEEGTHEELLETEGLYTRLHQMQFKTKEVKAKNDDSAKSASMGIKQTDIGNQDFDEFDDMF